MKVVLTTNVKIEQDVYEAFQILNIKRRKNKGEAIGDLITEEVRKNTHCIEGK